MEVGEILEVVKDCATCLRSCIVSRAASACDRMAHRELSTDARSNENGADAGVVSDMMRRKSLRAPIFVFREAMQAESASLRRETEMVRETKTARRVDGHSKEGTRPVAEAAKRRRI